MTPAEIARSLTEALCPNFEDHAISPEGYIQWHHWAEQMSTTHRQEKCHGCGRYVIWVPKPIRAELAKERP